MSTTDIIVKQVYFIARGSLRGSQGGPGPSNFWKNEKKCVFNKRTSKVCVSCS